MPDKKILFISHTATRTGAPINLLRFLRWFKEHTDIPFRILLQSGGELLPEFDMLAPVDVLYPDSFSRPPFWHRFAKTSGLHTFVQRLALKMLKEGLLRDNIGLIYSNTAANGEVLEMLSPMNCPVISHIHELEYYIHYHIGQEYFDRVKTYTHRYIAISDVVKRNLEKHHHIAEEQIETIYDFLPDSLLREVPDDIQQKRIMIRQRLNLPEDAFLICASGTIDWRKGPDIFLQLAAFMRKHHADLPIYFIWVGGETQGRRYGQLRHDISGLGLEEAVHFVGAQSDPLPYFAACDLFTLVSREEPFGLVCLEAAILGKPSVCFEGSGIQEFIEDDCGYVVPYLDIEAMAARCVELFFQPELRLNSGQQARQKVRQRHAVDRIAPQIMNVIQQTM